ncbi:MAG: hypothetical protein NVSMB5_19520 [Candidatus Velthaea sp.]
MNHISEELELYALGMLDSADRARVDLHVRDCAECCERLASAEAAVAIMLDGGVSPLAAPLASRVTAVRSRPVGRRLPWGVAAAALFALCTGVLGQIALGLQGTVRDDDARLARMIHSHFNHAQFVSPHGTPIAAKVIYDRAGTWYDVIAIDADLWQVTLRSAGGAAPQRTFPLVRRGAVSTVTLTEKTPLREIDLRDPQGRLVGSVRPLLAGQERASPGSGRQIR